MFRLIREVMKTELHSNMNWEGEFSLSISYMSPVHALKEKRHHIFCKNITDFPPVAMNTLLPY
jgi:hypothetical protein